MEKQTQSDRIAPKATLWSIPFSHPAWTAKLMLRQAGVEYEAVELPAGSQAVALRTRGFRRGTVPAMRIDGQRVQGSVEISRALDRLHPEARLFPSDPERRSAVEEAERWGEAVYQHLPRRTFRWSVTVDGDLRRYLAKGARMPLPGVAANLLILPTAVLYARATQANAPTVRHELATLPSHLDRIDDLIAAGTLGGETLNAADFQIGTTTRVLLNLRQLEHLIEGRPAAEHAMRVLPKFPFAKDAPGALPDAWIPRARTQV